MSLNGMNHLMRDSLYKRQGVAYAALRYLYDMLIRAPAVVAVLALFIHRAGNVELNPFTWRELPAPEIEWGSGPEEVVTGTEHLG